MRQTIIAGILVLWIGSLAGLFLYSPAGPEPAPMPSLSEAAVADEEWWGVYMQGHKVGFVRQALTQSDNGLAFQEESVLRMTTLGEKQTVRMAVSGTLTTSYELRNLEMTLSAGPTELAIEAVTRGTELLVTLRPGSGDKQVIEIPFTGTLSLPLGLRKAALRVPLQAGRVTRGMVFDPLTRATGPFTLTIGQLGRLPGHADAVAWRVDEEWRDVRSVLWVDEQGRLLREEGPMGLLAIREAKATAMMLADEDSDWDAVDAVSIPVDPPIENARTRERLRVRLKGIALERIPLGDGQSLHGSDLLIQRAHPDQFKSYPLPYDGGDHARELEPTEMLQSDDPRILTLTKTILNGQSDALAATRLLVDWVYRYLKKIPTASVPNALEILDVGQGDCNEHAVLFTAVARAAGVPSRVVSGTVYADRAFLYHAWSEVWLGRWVPVDAALNQVPADATHIRLAAGDRDQDILLMGILGNLGIEVLRDVDDDVARR